MHVYLHYFLAHRFVAHHFHASLPMNVSITLLMFHRRKLESQHCHGEVRASGQDTLCFL